MFDNFVFKCVHLYDVFFNYCALGVVNLSVMFENDSPLCSDEACMSLYIMPCILWFRFVLHTGDAVKDV